jgi:hypothetical protein
MSEFALVITQQSVYLYRLSIASAKPIAVAESSENPLAWLAENMPTDAYCSLVSDIMDESYVQSNLPPIWLPSTRQQLLSRRLQQQLRDTPYRAAVLLPSGSWRPPTRASLISMGQTERINQWLEALTEHKVRIKGLWPLSALITVAVKSKKSLRPPLDKAKPSVPASQRPILALVSTPAGLRQVLIIGKTPLFSRLSPTMSEAGVTVSFAAQEARRTIQYLTAQNWLEEGDQPVATQMWLPQGDEQAQMEASNDPTLELQGINVFDNAYERLLPLLKKVAPQTQFLPESYRTSWRAAQITRNSKYAGIAALVVASLWSAELIWESLNSSNLARSQIAQAAAINLQARQEVQQAKGDLSEAGLAVATVQTWDAAIAKQPGQLAAMQHLVNGFKNTPGIVLQKIRWELPKQQVAAVASAGAAAEPFGCAGSVAKPEATPAAKPIIAMLNLTLLLPAELSQRQAVTLQDTLLVGLNTNGWTTSIVKSSFSLDALQAQNGALGRIDPREVDLCLQKAAP